MALAAVRTWQTVSSGFFFPLFLMHLGQEEQAHGTDDQMSLKRQVVADLKMIHSDLGLFILEAPLHRKTGEGHSKQLRSRRCRRTIGHEVFHLVVIPVS